MAYEYFNGQQGYPQTPMDHNFGPANALPSSSPADSQPFHDRSFRPHVGSLGFPDQYGFSQSNQWSQNNVSYTNLPVSSTSSFDLDDVSGYTRSEHDSPWDPTRGSQGRVLDNGVHLFGATPASNFPKAQTVAGPEYDGPFKRPSPRQRQSFASITDSGYGSQATLIDGITSAKNGENKTTELSLIGIGLSNTEAPARPSSVKTEPISSGPKQVKRRRSKSFIENCTICNKELKNRSESQKHRLQHDKPYHCEGCGRKDGFATLNDLERHRKSVHGAWPKVGKTSVYLCQACKPSPGSRPKQWPRLDNFKAHIRRKHPTYDLDQLIRDSEIERPTYPESQYAYSQHSTSHPDEVAYQQDLSSPVGNPMSRHASQQHGDFNTLFNHHDSAQQLAHVGGVVDYHVNNVRDPQSRNHRWSAGTPMMMLHAAAHQELASASMNSSPTSTRHSIPSISINDRAFHPHDEMELDAPSFKRPRTLSAPSPSIHHNAFSPINGSGHTEGEHRCRVCDKVKKRECDLRKHMKRHTRPYGCTFAKCNKRFGSRNDWKRHENSQHFLSEMWRCEIERSTGTRCGHISHDRQLFAKHLESAHSIKVGSEENKKQCSDMHLGREGHHHFWCGFCNKLIEQAEGIQPVAWDVRFKHIGDHFDKDNYVIDDWIDIEKNKKKKTIENEEKSKAASSKAKIDDDSDLGDDGIPPVAGTFDVDADGDTDDEFGR